jgi:hypothetical protein
MRDTSPEAERVWLESIRALPPAVRVRQMLEASEWHREVMVAGLRRRYPGASDLQLVELALGVALVPAAQRPEAS